MKGIGYLRTKLSSKRSRVLLRYEYYEMKNRARDLSLITPPKYRWLNSTLGWCTTAVDSLADRLVFNEFKNDTFDLNTIYNMNNADVLFSSAILSALISSCCFIYISLDDDNYPRLEVIDGSNATGVIDETTGLLEEGYAVLKRDDNEVVIDEAYFAPGQTDFYHQGEFTHSVKNNVAYPLLVPIIFRPDARRPFGHSRISRACMSIMQEALRTLKRSEISAEFYSFPQKYVTGLSQDAEDLDKWKATMSSLLVFSKDDEGDSPSLGQFSQQSMTPYTEQLKMFASLFAGETGLTLDDLGFVSDNPSSAEAIKASHENLRLTARSAQKTFGTGFLNVGYTAACLRDNQPYKRNLLYRTKVRWEPIFEPDSSALSGIGDGVIKINQAIPDYIDSDTMKDLTGINNSSTQENTSTANYVSSDVWGE